MNPRPSWLFRAGALAAGEGGGPARRAWRALPFVLPLAALAVIAAGEWGVAAARQRAERAAHQGLVDLEGEVARLRGRGAPAAAQARAAAGLRGLLPQGAADVAAVLARAEAEANSAGWRWQARPEPAAIPRGPLGAAAFAATLRPAADNASPWASLLGLLETFSRARTRIEVTRLAIRADEQGRYSVETRLSIAYLAEHQIHPQ